MSRCRSYKYLLRPTVPQRMRLERLLRDQCELYNAALEDRRGAWRWERRSVSFFEQCRTLTELRAVRPEVLEFGVTVCRGTLKRLDWAFVAFYRRCQRGQKPGFPRFKASRRFDSVQWEDTSGWKLDVERGRLRLLGVGDVKVHLHRPTRGRAKAITVARAGRRWWVTVRCVDVPAEPLPATGREVGLDLGVCAFVTTSDGEMVTEGRYGRAGAERLAAAQRALATKRRGSGQRRRVAERVAAAHRTVHNRHEDLAITNMMRRPKPRPNQQGGFDPNGARAKAGLDRSISDSGWGQLLSLIAYKAEEAGREIVAVNPRHTSQRCSACAHTAADNRVTQAKFHCQACGHQAHADVNAAINILWAGRAQRASARGGSLN